MPNRIEIEVRYEDGSLTNIKLPNKSNNEVFLYILDDQDKIIDKKTLLLGNSILEFL